MLTAYDVSRVRRAEEAEIERLPEGTLMRRAADALAEHVRAWLQPVGRRAVVVLAGPGNNGGDALYAAAALAAAHDVAVVGVATQLHLGGVRAVRDAGARLHLVPPDDARLPPEVGDVLRGAHVVVDGLLGIGGQPGLRGAMASVASAVPDTAYVVAVDLPSGADPAGEAPVDERRTLVADETVTFGVLKPVHLLPATEAAVGRVTVVDIGFEPPDVAAVERLTADDVAGLWPVPGADDDKYSRGVVGVVAGSQAYPGAAVLCATAAVEAGAGMVRYLGPRRAEDLVLAACPEVVPGPGRVQALVVGSGVAAPDRDQPEGADGQVEQVHEAFAADVPVAVDAGGLELLARWLAEGRRRAAPTLLTPHAGELARLLTVLEGREVSRDDVQRRPVGHVRRAAELTQATVLLKGSTTLVVSPDPAVPVRSQRAAPAWLATAGSGDVLAGVVGVLLAAGLAPRDAGSLGALVHGLAAQHANPGGPLRALAVARSVPQVVARLVRGDAAAGGPALRP